MPPLINRTAYRSGVWGNAPIVETMFDQSIAVLLDEQFNNFDTTSSTGDWVSTQATSGTAAISTAAPGALLLDAGATTDNQGIQIQRTKSPLVPAANKSIWWETKVTLSASTPPVTRAQLFIGYAAIDTTVIASGAMSTQNHLGFLIVDGGLLVSTFSADKAGTGTTKTGHTFVAATAVKLGFRYDGVADQVIPYVNGVALTSSAIATANVPKVAIYPTVVVQADSTDRPTLLVEGWRHIQLR